MSDAANLNKLLVDVNNNRGHVPSSYVQELITLVGDYHAEAMGEEDPIIKGFRRSAQTLNLIHDYGIDDAWTDYRQDVNWPHRWTLPKKAPTWFVENFIKEQKQKARADVAKALGRDIDV